ncbi:MAG: TolC family protein [Bdellovibrionota bacterium]|nr:TolC family protein [Bdellovibrionota bacterium]
MKFLITLSLFLGINAYAETLTLDEVLSSTKEHFPLIQKSYEDIVAAKAKRRSAIGGFDASIDGKLDQRPQGYYDGQSQSVKIVKPLQSFGAKVYGGYRVSEGSYPDYEGKYNTLDNGEYSVGVALSLWRDSFIDSKRLKLRNSELDVSIAENAYQQAVLKYQSLAMKSYWEWVAYGKTLRIQKELLEMAQKRTFGLERRSNRGDLAKIYLTENNQYIVKRKADVLKAQQSFEQLSYELSLFYRNKKGEPVIPRLGSVPENMLDITPMDITAEEKKLQEILKKTPQIQILKNEILSYKNEKEFGENSLKPKVDFNVELSDDQGDGPKNLRPTEVRAMVNFSVPLERNLGNGQTQAAEAKIRALEKELAYLEQYTKVTLDRLIVQLNIASQIITNTAKEIEYAETLRQAEYKKFQQGASDFFVVNLREQNKADAQVKQVDAYLKYQKAYAEYLYLMLSF